MSTPEIKKEIHDYVENADSRVLRLIYAMILADKGHAANWHQSVVEERLAEYEANPSNIIAWDDLKKRIEAMR
jgi:hypothetical protein